MKIADARCRRQAEDALLAIVCRSVVVNVGISRSLKSVSRGIYNKSRYLTAQSTPDQGKRSAGGRCRETAAFGGGRRGNCRCVGFKLNLFSYAIREREVREIAAEKQRRLVEDAAAMAAEEERLRAQEVQRELEAQQVASPSHVERLVFHCRTTSASTAPCTSRGMCCPTHCAC